MTIKICIYNYLLLYQSLYDLISLCSHRDISLENFHFYAYILNEHAKEEKEQKKKTTDWPTFHRVLLRKSGEHLFSSY